MKNYPQLPPDIELPDQQTESLDFVVMGNNGKLEALVSSVGVHMRDAIYKAISSTMG
jgi:hypothetical protein